MLGNPNFLPPQQVYAFRKVMDSGKVDAPWFGKRMRTAIVSIKCCDCFRMLECFARAEIKNVPIRASDVLSFLEDIILLLIFLNLREGSFFLGRPRPFLRVASLLLSPTPRAHGR